MSSTIDGPRISDVLEILSVQSISDDNYQNIPAPLVELRNYEREKQIFTDAVHYCMVLLRQSNRITNHKSDILSMEATVTGHEMYERIINVNVQMDLEMEDHTYLSTSNFAQEPMAVQPNSINDNYKIKEEIKNTTIIGEPLAISDEQTARRDENCTMDIQGVRVPELGENMYGTTNCTSDDFLGQISNYRATMSNIVFGDCNFPPSPLSVEDSDDTTLDTASKKYDPGDGTGRHYISLDIKKKVVQLSRLHPEWSLKMLQKYGSEELKSTTQLKQWERHISTGGTLRDKHRAINKYTYRRFLEASASSKTVKTETLREWAIQGARELYGTRFNFEAKRDWLYSFKKLYDLQGSVSCGFYKRDDNIFSKVIKLRERRKGVSTSES